MQLKQRASNPRIVANPVPPRCQPLLSHALSSSLHSLTFHFQGQGSETLQNFTPSQSDLPTRLFSLQVFLNCDAPLDCLLLVTRILDNSVLGSNGRFQKESLPYRGQTLSSLLIDVAEDLTGIGILHQFLARFRPLPSGWFRFSLKGK